MLFFLTFARITSGVFTEDSMWGIYGYGLSAAIFASLVTIPRLVMLVVGGETVEGNGFNFSDLACLIFIVSYIFASLGVGFKSMFNSDGTFSYNEAYEDDDEEIIATNAGIPKREEEKEVFGAEEAYDEEDDDAPIIPSATLASVKKDAVIEEQRKTEVQEYAEAESFASEEAIEESNDIYSYSNPEEKEIDDINKLSENTVETPVESYYEPAYTQPVSEPESAPVVTNTDVLPQEPVKRGRGRPRKNPLPEVETVVSTPVIASQELPQGEVKRGRGRPRKNPLPEVAETTAKVAVSNIVTENKTDC